MQILAEAPLILSTMPLQLPTFAFNFFEHFIADFFL
jgi:hypothetical protein